MKLIHISDLHLGKNLNGFSLLKDQEDILKKIMEIIRKESPDGVIVAGDVFDKSVPPVEAVELFDDFLVQLVMYKLQVFVISGNHDSPERIAYGGRIMETSGIHLSPVYNGNVMPVTLRDDYGEIKIYLLPFIKPTHVRRYFEEETIESYTDAIRVAIDHMNVDKTKRNILVTHQFVTDAVRSESEDISVGGSDNVDAAVFEGFDYVALGHLHRAQNAGSNQIRYCGTPLKYSFSESADEKSVTVIEFAEKGNLRVRTIELCPLRDMVKIRGSYEEVTARDFYAGTTYQEDYVQITLTDEEDIPDVIGKLRSIYKNLMKIEYNNKRTRQNAEIACVSDVEKKSPFQIFSEFYEKQNNTEMTSEQAKFMQSLITEVWEDEE